MDLEKIRLIKCKGCSNEFAINAIRSHLGKRPSCKKEYSQEESSELNQICSAHKKQKKKASYKNRKKQKLTEDNVTSPVPSTSKDQDRNIKSENNKVLKPAKINCRGCSKSFLISSIRHHLKMKPDCKNKYSETNSADLNKLCDSNKAEKQAHWNIKNKKDKICRPQQEIDTIIKTMKKVRRDLQWSCMYDDDVKLNVYILKDMKQFFKNQSQVEKDIREYIATTFEDCNDGYDYAMKEIIWTMEYLLSNPNIPIAEEIADLKTHLCEYTFRFINANIKFDLYKNNIIRQLPQEAKKYFKQKIDEEECEDYYTDFELESKDVVDSILYPFEDPCDFITKIDPDVWEAENYEDEFTCYLKSLCKGCGKKYQTILQHLGKSSVDCSQYYSDFEMEALKDQINVSMSKICQISNENQKRTIMLIDSTIEKYFCKKDFKVLQREKIHRIEKYDMSAILDKHDVPDHLITKAKQIISKANEIHDKLDEEYYNVKDQVIEELGPNYNWTNSRHDQYHWTDSRHDQYHDIYFICIMSQNLKIYLRNEEIKTEFLIWDILQDIANQIGANLDETLPKSVEGRDMNNRNLYLESRFHNTNQKKLQENLYRYLKIKQEMLECYRFGTFVRAEWQEKLGLRHDYWNQGRHEFEFKHNSKAHQKNFDIDACFKYCEHSPL